MKKTLFFLLIVCCNFLESHAQNGWTVPRLHELTQAHSIKNRIAHLSAEDITLLKKLTKE